MNAEIIKELDKILPVVVRVHGEHHPELARVAELYNAVKANATAETWAELKTITNDYTAPADACPTFIKTYADLKDLADAQS